MKNIESTHYSTAVSALLVGAAITLAACSSDDPIAASARSPQVVTGELMTVGIATHGKLSNGMDGYAWVAAAELATVDEPNPCNENGCFNDVQNGLCTKGTLPALTCASADSWDCNFDKNWGVLVGLNPDESRGAWGAAAPQSIALAYSGGPGTYRLVAHKQGDPEKKVYCLDGYVSGLSVTASQLKTECWSDGGESLESFAVVDMVGLTLGSAKEEVSFDYCVTDVTLNAPVDTSRVLIGDNGKLSGAMSGYTWAAKGDLGTITSPSPCDSSGCFRATGGKLCAQGSLPALECTGQGTSDYDCNWDENWGAMIGMNPNVSHTAWGQAATSKVAFTYAGGSGTYQLTAHVAGDPNAKNYCIRDYQSGQEVTASQFKTECWSDTGHSLNSFADVDSFGLVILSAESPVSFDYCISAISAQ